MTWIYTHEQMAIKEKRDDEGWGLIHFYLYIHSLLIDGNHWLLMTLCLSSCCCCFLPPPGKRTKQKKMVWNYKEIPTGSLRRGWKKEGRPRDYTISLSFLHDASWNIALVSFFFFSFFNFSSFVFFLCVLCMEKMLLAGVASKWKTRTTFVSRSERLKFD